MNLPAILFGFLLASAVGLSFHLLRGGPWSRLGLYLLAAWIGFAIGHQLATWFDWAWIRIGSLNLLAALFGAGLALVAADFLVPEPPSGGERHVADDEFLTLEE